MPTYQYRCLNCKRRFDVYMSYSEYGSKSITCPHCASDQVQRRIGRIRFARSEESRLENLSDPTAWGDVDESDPRSMARMMRRMGNELGEEMGPDFHEAVDRLEDGEDPEQIEKSMPDLGGGMNAGGLDDLEE